MDDIQDNIHHFLVFVQYKLTDPADKDRKAIFLLLQFHIKKMWLQDDCFPY